MKVLQINTTANVGSTGRIAEQIGLAVMARGGESIIAYGLRSGISQSTLIRIDSKKDYRRHRNLSKLTDMQGRFSTRATKRLVEQIKTIAPDIIHLHNLHGNYINYKILFDYLSEADIPVVWTLHDCWPITGHCTHFVFAGCDKWKTECYDCPEKKSYLKSLIFDRSRKNYLEKREIFNSVKNMTIVPVSKWLGSIVRESFLKDCNIKVIYNGIDIETFKPINEGNLKEKHNIPTDKKVILGVATSWNKQKGFDDFLGLYDLLPREKYQIIMIGLTQNHINLLPHGVIGLQRTESVKELAEWYSIADVFANLSYAETFGLTTVEALASGTPVIVYNNTASPELIDSSIGRVVETGNIKAVAQAIQIFCTEERDNIRSRCREYAIARFDKKDSYQKYIELYKNLINKSK